MSKRFTDTQKWQKSWFMDLPLKWKLAWCWAIDNCDHAGILSSNARLMSFMIGEPIDADEFLKTMQGRIVKLPNGRLFIPSFISFQYGPLYPSNPAHKGVIRIMEREGLMDEIDVRSSEEGSHRTRIGKTTRFKILVRDGMRCHYCEQIGTFDNLVVDHIIPTSKGGNNDDENLICACVSCNSEKQDRDYTEFITQKRDKLSLKSPFKILNGAKDMDKDMDKNTVKDTQKAPTPTLPFDSRSFAEAWQDFIKHRTEIKKPLKPTSTKMILSSLKAMGERRAVIALRHTIEKGWQGVREPDIQDKNRFDRQYTQQVESPALREPQGWRLWLEKEYPGNLVIAENRPWSSVDPSVQQKVIQALQK